MKRFHALFIYLFVSVLVFGQSKPEVEVQNIVPNPGFEHYSAPPIGWFYKGQHFTNVVQYWSAASAASPDVFGPRVRVPAHWAEKDFGKQKARNGDSMAGITVYGCDEGKPHCREYVQIQLSEPLVVDQNYYAEFWVSHLPRSLQINNLGMYFSEYKSDLKTDDLIALPPQVNADYIVDASNNNWVKVAGSFKARKEASYIIIGNFFPDSLTLSREVCDDNFKFAYYYLDDVFVKKEKPILPVPVKEDDLTRIEMKKGQLIRLKNIFFETDKAELLPRSYIELRKLLKIMKENAKMVIQINGHTDIRGDNAYNLDLSLRRARAVVEFLNKNKISTERTKYKGFGSNQPIASNTTEEGRQLNRRVEFLILQK